jgi:hypothetical protein
VSRTTEKVLFALFLLLLLPFAALVLLLAGLGLLSGFGIYLLGTVIRPEVYP